MGRCVCGGGGGVLLIIKTYYIECIVGFRVDFSLYTAIGNYSILPYWSKKEGSFHGNSIGYKSFF